MTIVETDKKRGPGRPSKESRKRPERVPVGGFRDKLTVQGRDPNFVYRWVLDMDATGSRVLNFLQGGYEFVKGDEVIIGETYVFASPDYGSIIRRPGNKQGDYLYLMKIRKEYYEEDAKAKQDLVNQTEDALYSPDSLRGDREGVYGDIKIK